MQTNYKTEAVAKLAQEIKSVGFRVFIAKSGTYGFYTDQDGTKVVCFQFDLGGFKFTGNYKTDQPKQCGTGWGLEDGSYQNMFSQYAPRWAVRDANWRFTTLAEHLNTYQQSSQYTELTN